MLSDPYAIQPWQAPVSGEISLPGSKSLTNRALVLAALCPGRVRLEGALFSRDTRILVDSLAALGFEVTSDAEAEWIEVTGRGGAIPSGTAEIFVGNAGTAARFLTAFVCLHPNGRFHFDGDEEMRHRPMAGLLDTLQSLGAKVAFSGEEGCFPFEIKTGGLPGGEWNVDAAASSQMLSALLQVAPFARGEVRLGASGARPAFVEMTAGLMGRFGVEVQGSPSEGYRVSGDQLYEVPAGGAFPIEPDATAASYFMILPAVVGGTLRIAGLSDNMLQGDIAFAAVAESLGLIVTREAGGLTVQGGGPLPSKALEYDFTTFSDTFLTLAAMAPLLPVPVRIKGIGHTRFQETDRIRAMANELKRIGAGVEEGESSLLVQPFPPGWQPGTRPVTIDTYKDHRVAMSFGVLGCSPRFGSDDPWIRIADPACCGKTFPSFFDELDQLYRISHDKK